MNLTNESTVRTITESATHLNFMVKFRYELTEGQARPTSITVNFYPVGVPTDNPHKNNLTVSNDGGVSGRWDSSTPNQLIADITAQCLVMINGEEEE